VDTQEKSVERRREGRDERGEEGEREAEINEMDEFDREVFAEENKDENEDR
jgi:hypothetical protein